MYDGNPGGIDFGSSEREVRVYSEGSSYRKSTVLVFFKKTFDLKDSDINQP